MRRLSIALLFLAVAAHANPECLDYVLSSKVGRYMTPLAPGESVAGWRPGGLPFKATFDYISITLKNE